VIDLSIAYLNGAILLIAGMFELACVVRGKPDFLWSARLAAFGFFVLGARYLYLVWTNDIGRLSIYGTASIACIALSRIISCATQIQMRFQKDCRK